MGSSLDELLKAEFKEAFDEFDKVSLGETSSTHCTAVTQLKICILVE